MQSRRDFAFEFQKRLAPMVAEEVISSDNASLVSQMVGDILDEYANALAMTLTERYKVWERSVGVNDDSLYSLGLRHATDLILEIDSTERAPVLAAQYERELESDNEE